MRLLARLLFAATCVMFAVQAGLLAASTHPMLSAPVLVDQAFPLVGIGAVIGAGIGLLITTRYPRNPIGWLFLVGQLGSITGLAADAFTVLVVDGTVDAPLAGLVCAYVKRAFDATYTMVFLSIIFMIAPDGRLLSRRWRFALGVPIAALALRLGVLFAQPASDLVPGTAVELGAVATAVLLLDVAALLTSLALGATALIVRMRGSTAQQRLQLRWVASAAAVVALALLVYIGGQLLLSPPPWWLAEALYLAYIYVSVAVGIAILRYRLFDIEVILSRAIVLAVLVAFVTVGYIAVVVLIAAILSATGAPGTSLYWPSLIATALVAAAFQPLRRHVVRLADQLVYGRRALPYEALATLSRRLADAPSPEALPATVAEATGRAVGAAWACVTIEHRGVATTGACSVWRDPAASPAPAGAALVLPVVDLGERIGTIEVAMPPGRPMRSSERRLVEDVAAQAGIAFRNTLLEAELAARVAQGRQRSIELAASRRRLVRAEDDARARLAEDIRLRVIPHLAAVENGVRAVCGGEQEVTPPLLGKLITDTDRAVQELRLVCRGVFPALLERRGLVPALADRLSKGQPAAVLEIDESAQRRLDPAVEAAGYVLCEEVSSSGRLHSVGVAVDGSRLTITLVVTPDGTDAASVNGAWTQSFRWQHARDRIAALGGWIAVYPAGGGEQDAEVGAIEPGAIEPGAIEPGAIEPAAIEAGAIEVGAVAVRDIEVSAVDVGAIEVGAIEVRATLPLPPQDVVEPLAADQMSTSASGPNAAFGR